MRGEGKRVNVCRGQVRNGSHFSRGPTPPPPLPYLSSALPHSATLAGVKEEVVDCGGWRWDVYNLSPHRPSLLDRRWQPPSPHHLLIPPRISLPHCRLWSFDGDVDRFGKKKKKKKRLFNLGVSWQSGTHLSLPAESNFETDWHTYTCILRPLI